MTMIFRRKKGSKYNNHKVNICGIDFDSTKESKRYLILKDAERKGLISNLQLQVKYELIPPIKEEYVEHLKTKDKMKVRTLQLPITYTCDFQYTKDNETVIEDVKASPKMIPKEFTLKEKLFFWKYRIKIRKVYKPTEAI
jgi:hypothetical protein